MTQISNTNELELPSKWDIIPIHTSDRATFKRCRRLWDWKSPSRQNLVRRVDMFGLVLPLWFGSGIHYALEKFYAPGLRRGPVEAFSEWFDIQYNGGVVTADWLARTLDPKPIPMTEAFIGSIDFPPDNVYDGALYRIRGLNELLPYEDHTEIFEHQELGIGMLEFYEDYARRNDSFEVIATEHDFSVPIWDFDNDCILDAIDTRKDSPNYGKSLEVHYRGRMDMITKAERYGIMDHKTMSSFDDDWERKLDLDEQCTSYLWAAEVEAQYYGLPYTKLEGVIYQALRKAFPTHPTILRNGDFSIDRKNESTTWEIMQQYFEQAPHWRALAENSMKHKAYIEYLQEAGDEQFIIRKPVLRNRHQIVNAGRRIYLEAMDMLNNPSIYPNPTGDYPCLNCDFRAPCIAKEDGSDHESMIAEGYISNKDR